MSKHPGSIDVHGGSWRVRLCVGGHRHVFKLDGATSREAVEQYAREKSAELGRRNGKALPCPGMRFSELLARYREAGMPGVLKPETAAATKKSYATSLQAAETFFVNEARDPIVRDMTRGGVQAFMDWRRLHSPDGSNRTKPLSARGVAKDRVVLHVLFKWASAREYVEANPVSPTKAPEGHAREPILLSADKYEALLTECDSKTRPMLYLYVLTLGETGVRCDSEALWIRWEDIDLSQGLINVASVPGGHRTKSGKSRRVPITPRLAEAIRAHMARFRFASYHGERTEWVFHHELDRRHATAGSRLGGLRRAFAAAVKRAGLPARLHQHDLRHRRVTEWLRQGKGAAVVQKAMGHSTIRVTEKYTHFVDDDLLQLVEPAAAAERKGA